MRVVSDLCPDLLVIPECGDTALSQMELGAPGYTGFEWIGRIPSKGLGVFSFGDYSISRLPAHNSAHRLILPLEVSGPREFILLAVWTLPDDIGSYVRPLVEALREYAPVLDGRDVVMAGDFNAGVNFPGKPGFHFQVFLELAESCGMRSLYHETSGEPHGQESAATFFMQRNRAKPFHIDFIFAGEGMRSRFESLDIGGSEQWLAHSDHMPLTAAFR